MSFYSMKKRMIEKEDKRSEKEHLERMKALELATKREQLKVDAAYEELRMAKEERGARDRKRKREEEEKKRRDEGKRQNK